MSQLRRMLSLIVFLGGMTALSVLALPHDPLENIRIKIENAQDQGAVFKAPASLRRAETELQRAEDTLIAKPRHPLALEHALEMATYRAVELMLVLDEIKSSRYRIDEETAIRRVRQRHPASAPMLSKQVVAEVQ